jgi:hypothetical protein
MELDSKSSGRKAAQVRVLYVSTSLFFLFLVMYESATFFFVLSGGGCGGDTGTQGAHR